MLALTFICYYKFISYISKKVSGGDVARKYKYPLEKNLTLMLQKSILIILVHM